MHRKKTKPSKHASHCLYLDSLLLSTSFRKLGIRSPIRALEQNSSPSFQKALLSLPHDPYPTFVGHISSFSLSFFSYTMPILLRPTSHVRNPKDILRATKQFKIMIIFVNLKIDGTWNLGSVSFFILVSVCIC